MKDYFFEKERERENREGICRYRLRVTFNRAELAKL